MAGSTHLGNFTGVLVHIHHRTVLDVASPIRILQGVRGFVLVRRARSNAGNHKGPGVAADAVLQQPREYVVAIGHVACGSDPRAAQAKHKCIEGR